MTTFDRIKPKLNDANAVADVLTSQVEFSVAIQRQAVPFGSTVADFDCSEWSYRVKSLHGASDDPVLEFEYEDWIPARVLHRWTHPTGMAFQLEFTLKGIIGRSYAAYGVEVERDVLG